MDYINIFNLEKKRTLENVGYVIKNGKYYSNYKLWCRNIYKYYFSFFRNLKLGILIYHFPNLGKLNLITKKLTFLLVF